MKAIQFQNKKNYALKIAAFVILPLTLTCTAQGVKDLSLPQKAPVLKLTDPLPANLFVELGKTINPAVVNISTKTLPKRIQRRNYDPMMDLLEQFYGYQGVPQQTRPQHALGSGFIIRDDGLIITNNHVIAGADVIQVQLVEKSEKLYEAKVIGSDERTDIALIKISADIKFPTVTLGSSKDTEVGEWVAAFGNPLGYGHTLSKGIISAKERSLGDINKFPLLQTDTSINPGNSGGPLVNSKGLVIGVNSAIDARAIQGGIGFAIPIDEVKSILPQLEKKGRISKGFLGVGLGILDPRTSASLGLKEEPSVVIAEVQKGGPADAGKLRPYDIVLEFNNKKITSPNEFSDAVADSEVGSKASLKVFRDGKHVSLNVVVGERPDFSSRKSERPQKTPQGYQAPFQIGMTLVDLNDSLRQQYEIEESKGYPLVSDVSPQGLAAKVGVRPGDLILDVNKKEVKSAQDAVKQFNKGINTLRLRRGEGVVIIVLDVNSASE
jgi:serine protease Do